ncbi:trypsin-like serine protease [Streptomyces sp. NBC_01304]|uniref:trypsin-like serine protease n=1 Tax=Streptomyces sp. NBC_01304 TaxID=2903818 RepID=UPI002E155B01|nr:trypsin-like serine protease [Streptomyces sp. NBC_01304]
MTETREVIQIVKHQDSSEHSVVNDIALIKLKAPMLNLTAVNLPTQGQKFTGKATVAGWGTHFRAHTKAHIPLRPGRRPAALRFRVARRRHRLQAAARRLDPDRDDLRR